MHNDYAFQADGVDVAIAMQEIDERGFPVRTDSVLRLAPEPDFTRPEVRFMWHHIEDHERGMNMQFPHMLRLPEGAGQAVLEALSRYYNGTADNTAIRADRDRERSRRDLTEDRLWELASGMASTQGMCAGHVQDILFQAVRNLADSDGVGVKLAEYLNNMITAQTMATQHPGPPLRFHESTEFGRCRGHMPWDYATECTA